MVAPLEALKFNLQERQYPYFEDVELQLLLENNENNVLKASWKGCLFKATADDKSKIGSIETPSNREYWLGMAEQYENEYKKSLSGTKDNTAYRTTMRRADGQ